MLKKTLSNTRTGLIVLFVLFIASACKPKKSLNENVPVAKVLDKYLYLSDIKHIFPEKVSKVDSIAMAQAYIRTWIKNQLLVNKAEINLPPEQLDINQQIEAYRSSLIIFKYEDEMIRNKLDTVVKDSELQSYYDQNGNNFVLEENLVKTHYLKIPKTAPNLDKIKKWYKSSSPEDSKQMESYAYNYASKYDFFKDNWVSFNLVKNLLPNPIDKEEEFLKNNRTIEQEDDKFIYLVYISAYNPQGSVSPFIFVKSHIKDIIINKRKVKFINDLENKIYNDAQDHNNFVIYNLDKK